MKPPRPAPLNATVASRTATPATPRAGHGAATVVSSYFSTAQFARAEQALAWRRRVGHVVDVQPTRQQIDDGFRAEITRYDVGGLVLTDAYTDALRLERPVARVSADGRRDFAFHVFVEGESGHVSGMQRKRSAPDSVRGLVAFDLNQPFGADRGPCRVLTLFVPQSVVAEGYADSEALHGRIIGDGAPMTALVYEHLSATCRDIASLDPARASEAVNAAAQLLIAAYRKEARLSGAGRAALQVAVMGRIRRYVEANLHDPELTPTRIVDALQLKRATIYRWFEHEGGLGTYIRHRRLRAAADELARFPHLRVADIGYGLGFKSPSDFTRAFRRAFDVSPQDMRERALALRDSVDLADVTEPA